jgi:hypothetical protein
VWLRAEALGLEDDNEGWARDWLPEWLDAVSGGRDELSTVLPSEAYTTARPARPVKLLHRCADGVMPESKRDEAVDWPDFALQFPEVDALHRRMLRASDKLREGIATMEEESMEDEWSSDLATAQRCIFAAQAPDAYWRGRGKGFTDPKLRDAVMARLTRAERLIDALVQGEDDWISAEEEDRDGDLVDEVVVSSRHVSAWIVPGEGARVRTLDDRLSGRNVFDVGTGDRHTLQGMRDLVLDLETSPEELFSGSARELTRGAYEVRESAIDEAGDLTYRLQVAGELTTGGHTATSALVTKTLSVAIDKAELTLETKVRINDGSGILLATRIPVRLGHSETRLLVNGESVRAPLGRHDDVTSVRVEADDGSAFELELPEPSEVWIAVASREDPSQGFILAPVLRVQDEAQAQFSIRLIPSPQHAEQALGESTDADTDEGAGEETGASQDETVEEDDGGLDDDDKTVVPRP